MPFSLTMACALVAGVGTPPPARKLLLLARQGVSKEVEVLVDHRLVQMRRGPVNHLPAQVSLPMLKRMFHQQLFLGSEEVRRGNDIVVASRSLHDLQVNIPLEGGREGADLRQAHLVV